METEALALGIGTLTSAPLQNLGSVFRLQSGRQFKYVQFSNSSAIAAGTQVYSVISSVTGLAITTVANGQIATNLTQPSQTLTIVSTGAVTADTYSGGYAKISVSSGSQVYSVRIAHNTGNAAAGNFTLTFTDVLPNTVALIPGTDTVSVYTSPDYASTSSSSGNISCGYAVTALPALTSPAVTYGYTQVSGYSAVTGTIVNIE
jgi:uncharacterized repeat protein (TIGR01451 family)